MQNLITKIRETIKNTKFENKSFIAGGYVRDYIMNLNNPDYINDSHDLDICVELLNGGIELCKFLSEQLHGTTPVIFERFGTAQTVIDGVECEFVMTRKESYDGVTRNPEVIFGTIAEDVVRRDLTINSILLNISTMEIIDLLNGIKDIENKIINTTNNPDIIFKEDPLRILRTIRFAIRFDFNINGKVILSIIRNNKELDRVSRERIKDEFLKILILPNIEEALVTMHCLGLLKVMYLSDLGKCIGLKQNKYHTKDVFGHTMDVVNNSKNTQLHKLAALLHDIGKVATITKDHKDEIHFYDHEEMSTIFTKGFMETLKFSNHDIELVSSAVQNHMRITESISGKKIRKLRSELGEEKFNFLLDLCEADRLSHINPDISHITKMREMIKIEKTIFEKQILTGNEIMKIFNLKSGPKVGEILKIVQDLQFEAPERCTKAFLIDYLKLKINV